jgi:putative zinc finger protein
MTKQTVVSPCAEQEENLVLFHYGDLPRAEHDALQAHLRSCAACAVYLKDLGTLLPLTIEADQPPQTFWSDYNRELRQKLDGIAEKKSPWQSLAAFFQPRWVPAFATAAIVALALTFTLGKGMWSKNDPAKEDVAIMELLPVAENLDFFKSMDVLDDLDLLESMGSQGNAA